LFMFTVGIHLGYRQDNYTSSMSNASVGLTTIWIGVWWSQKYCADAWCLHHFLITF